MGRDLGWGPALCSAPLECHRLLPRQYDLRMGRVKAQKGCSFTKWVLELKDVNNTMVIYFFILFLFNQHHHHRIFCHHRRDFVTTNITFCLVNYQ